MAIKVFGREVMPSEKDVDVEEKIEKEETMEEIAGGEQKNLAVEEGKLTIFGRSVIPVVSDHETAVSEPAKKLEETKAEVPVSDVIGITPSGFGVSIFGRQVIPLAEIPSATAAKVLWRDVGESLEKNLAEIEKAPPEATFIIGGKEYSKEEAKTLIESNLAQVSQAVNVLQATPGVAKIREGQLVLETYKDPLAEYEEKVRSFYEFQHKDLLGKIGEAVVEIPQLWFRGAMSKSDPFNIKSAFYFFTGDTEKAIKTQAQAWYEVDQAFSKASTAATKVLTSPLASIFYSAGAGYVTGAGLGYLATKAPTAAKLVNIGATAALSGAVGYEAYKLYKEGDLGNVAAFLGMTGLTAVPFAAGMKAGYQKFIPEIKAPTKIETEEGTKYLVAEPEVKVSQAIKGTVEGTEGRIKSADVFKYVETPGESPVYVKEPIKGWEGFEKSPEFYIKSPEIKAETMKYMAELSGKSGVDYERLVFGATKTEIIGSRELPYRYETFENIVKSWKSTFRVAAESATTPEGKIFTMQYEAKYPEISPLRLSIAEKSPTLARLFGPTEAKVMSGKIGYEKGFFGGEGIATPGEGISIGKGTDVIANAGKAIDATLKGGEIKGGMEVKGSGGSLLEMRAEPILEKVSVPLFFAESLYPQITQIGAIPTVPSQLEISRKKAEEPVLRVEIPEIAVSTNVASSIEKVSQMMEGKAKTEAVAIPEVIQERKPSPAREEREIIKPITKPSEIVFPESRIREIESNINKRIDEFFEMPGKSVLTAGVGILEQAKPSPRKDIFTSPIGISETKIKEMEQVIPTQRQVEKVLQKIQSSPATPAIPSYSLSTLFPKGGYTFKSGEERHGKREKNIFERLARLAREREFNIPDIGKALSKIRVGL